MRFTLLTIIRMCENAKFLNVSCVKVVWTPFIILQVRTGRKGCPSVYVMNALLCFANEIHLYKSDFIRISYSSSSMLGGRFKSLLIYVFKFHFFKSQIIFFIATARIQFASRQFRRKKKLLYFQSHMRPEYSVFRFLKFT